MIELNKSDCDVPRFLWNGNGQVQTIRFNRVTFVKASSPFLLNATIRYHLSQFESTETTKEMRTNLYVDDWLTGSDSEEEIMKMMIEAESVMKRGGFNQTKWASNCQKTKGKFCDTSEGFQDLLLSF